jgi:murein DD-endopeptidase MepM/ murein hydrolase activator NlpD
MGYYKSYLTPYTIPKTWITKTWQQHIDSRSAGGVDFHALVGTPIKAPYGGYLTNYAAKGPEATGGNTVRIIHANGYKTEFMHLSKFVTPGKYDQGDVIGYSGGDPNTPGYSSGASTAPHIHWHLISPAGGRVDPLVYVGSDFEPNNVMMESNSSFGPIVFGYFPIGTGSEWFTKWVAAEAPSAGYKIHVSADPNDAEVIARSVLPKVRELKIFHKVVRDLQRYLKFSQGKQSGKFITIYTNSFVQADQVIDAIDPDLYDLRDLGGLRPGPIPFSTPSENEEPELPVGRSGLVFTRWYDKESED